VTTASKLREQWRFEMELEWKKRRGSMENYNEMKLLALFLL